MELRNDAAIVVASSSTTLQQKQAEMRMRMGVEYTPPEYIQPAERAQQIDHRIREIQDATKRSFVELGALLIEAEQKALHEYLADDNGNPYRSHDHWVSVALPYCRSTAYAAKRVVRELGDVPMSLLREIPRSNLEVLRLLPASERKHGWVKKAQQLGNEEFLAEVKQELPDLHLEGRRKMTLNFSETDHQTVNEAISKFQMSEGTESREAAITSWAQDYLSN